MFLITKEMDEIIKSHEDSRENLEEQWKENCPVECIHTLDANDNPLNKPYCKYCEIQNKCVAPWVDCRNVGRRISIDRPPEEWQNVNYSETRRKKRLVLNPLNFPSGWKNKSYVGKKVSGETLTPSPISIEEEAPPQGLFEPPIPPTTPSVGSNIPSKADIARLYDTIERLKQAIRNDFNFNFVNVPGNNLEGYLEFLENDLQGKLRTLRMMGKFTVESGQLKSITEMQNQISNLQRKLNRTEMEYDDTRQKLLKELTRLRSDLNSCRETIQVKNIDPKVIAGYKRQIQELQDTIGTIQNKSDKTVADLKERIHELEVQMSFGSLNPEQTQRLEEQIDQLQQQIRTLEETSVEKEDEFQQRMKESQRNVQALTQEIQKITTEKELLEDQMNILVENAKSQKKSKSGIDIEKFRKEIANLNDNIGELQKRLKSKQDELKNVKQTSHQSLEESRRYKNERDKCDTDLQLCEQNLDEYKKSGKGVENLQKKISQLEKDNADDKEAWDEHLNNLLNERSGLNQEINDLNENIANLEKSIKDLQRQNKDLSSEVRKKVKGLEYRKHLIKLAKFHLGFAWVLIPILRKINFNEKDKLIQNIESIIQNLQKETNIPIENVNTKYIEKTIKELNDIFVNIHGQFSP